MKNFTPAMLEALADAATALSVCWKIVRVDGVTLRLTDLDQPITVLGELYLPNGSTERTAISYTDGLSAQNIDIRGLFDSDLITEEDLLDGRYNYARVTVLLVFSERPELRPIELLRARMGETEIDRGNYATRLNSMSHAFRASVGETTSPICRTVFGDNRCKVPLVDHRITTTITEIVDARTFKVAAAIAAPSKYFYGRATMLNGVAAGEGMEIRSATADSVIIYLPYRNLPAVGNQIQIDAGCDYTRQTCKNVYNNLLNNRSEPDLPGQDELIAPTVSSS